MSSMILTCAVALFLCSLGAASPTLSNDTNPNNIILRDLAVPRFFGAAANTTFLYHDVNYTKVISTQVTPFIGSWLYPVSNDRLSSLYSLPKMRVSIRLS